MKSFVVTYNGTISNAFLKQVAQQFLEDTEEENITFSYDVTVTPDHLRVALTKPVQWESCFDLNARKRWSFDHDNKFFTTPTDFQLSNNDNSPVRDKSLELQFTGGMRHMKMGSRVLLAREFQLALGGLDIHAWVFDNPIAPLTAARMFWSQILPWIEPEKLPNGLPAEVHLVQRRQVLHLEATSFRTKVKQINPYSTPTGYKEGIPTFWEPSEEELQNSVNINASRETRDKDDELSERIRNWAASMTTEQRIETLASTEIRDARGTEISDEIRDLLINAGLIVDPTLGSNELKADFAWYVKQPVLEQLSTILNRLVGTQGGWNIRLSRLFILWWRAGLQFYINPDQPNDPGPGKDLLMNLVRIGLFAQHILTGKDLPVPVDPDLDYDYRLLLQNIADAQVDDTIEDYLDPLDIQAFNSRYRTVNGPGQRQLDIYNNIKLCRQEMVANITERLSPYLSAINNEEERRKLINQVSNVVTPNVMSYILMCESRFKEVLTSFFELTTLEGLLPRPITENFENSLFDNLTQDIVISLPSTVEIEKDIRGFPVKLVLSDIDGSINFGPIGSNVSIEFYGPQLLVKLSLEQIYLDFYYASYPKVNLKNVVLGFLSGGISIGALTNAGWGYANLDNPEFIFRVYQSFDPASQRTSPAVRFFHRSTADSSAWLAGMNLGATLISSILTGFASLCNTFNEHMFTAISDTINNKTLGGEWPTNFWNPTDGPPSVADRSSGMDVWIGRLAEPNELEGKNLSEDNINRDLVPSMAYLFTESYLTSWVRRKIDMRVDNTSGTTDLGYNQQDWETAFSGLSLPDPAGLPIPSSDDGPYLGVAQDYATYLSGLAGSITSGNPLPPVNCRRPASKPTENFYRTIAERYLPQVHFPESGQLDYAGEVILVYDVRVEAVRVEYIQRMIGMSNTECQRIPTDILVGPLGQPSTTPTNVFTINHQALRATRRGDESEYFNVTQTGVEVPELPDRVHGIKIGDGRVVFIPAPDGGEGGIFPGGLGGFSPGQIPGLEDLGEFVTYCQNPRCNWREIRRETVLKTFVNARVEIRCNLLLGFKEFGQVWPPKTDIIIQKDSFGVNSSANNLNVEPPFDGLAGTDILEQLETLCLEDAIELLKPLNGLFSLYTRVLPLGEIFEEALIDVLLDNLFRLEDDSPTNNSLRETVINLIRFDQSGSSTGLEYTVENGILYWPFELSERTGNIIEN